MGENEMEAVDDGSSVNLKQWFNYAGIGYKFFWSYRRMTLLLFIFF